VFGCIKRAQVKLWFRWWHHFVSNLGSHLSANRKKTRILIGEHEGFSSERTTSVPNGDVCRCYHFHLPVIAQVRTGTISGTWSTELEHVCPHEEGSGNEVISASVFNLTQQYCYETTSWSMRLSVWTISDSLVSWTGSPVRRMFNLPHLPISKCFWAKLYPQYTIELEDHPTRLVIGRWNCQLCHCHIFLWPNCQWWFVFRNFEELYFTRYEKQWGHCDFNKMVLQLISPWLWVNLSFCNILFTFLLASPWSRLDHTYNSLLGIIRNKVAAHLCNINAELWATITKVFASLTPLRANGSCHKGRSDVSSCLPAMRVPSQIRWIYKVQVWLNK
jgi:hypothetical protein